LGKGPLISNWNTVYPSLGIYYKLSEKRGFDPVLANLRFRHISPVLQALLAHRKHNGFGLQVANTNPLS